MTATVEVEQYMKERIEEKPTPPEEDAVKGVHHLTKAHAAQQFPLNTTPWSNWAATNSCQPTYFHRPETKQQILDILAYARDHEENVRVVGEGRSMSDIACTDSHMISLERFCRILNVDRVASRVKVESGITLGILNERLNEVGLALPNLPSISQLSVAGAISTGTHGTGVGFGILSTNVVELELITSGGNELTCSRKENTDVFLAALCSLGALGVISTVTLQCEHSFYLDAVRFPLPIETVLGDINKIVSAAEHVKIWWFPHTDKCIVWQANRARHPPPTPSTINLRKKLHEIADTVIGYYSVDMTYNLSHYNPRAVPYLNRLYRRLLFNSTRAEFDLSYKVFCLDNLVQQYIHSCSIPLHNVHKAIHSIKKMILEKKYTLHFPVQITFTAGDDIWLSPAYGGDRAFISLVLYKPVGRDTHLKCFSEFEQKMNSFGGRPHWGLFNEWDLSKCKSIYPKFEDFVKMREKLDPQKLFNNQYLQRIFGDY